MVVFLVPRELTQKCLGHVTVGADIPVNVMATWFIHLLIFHAKRFSKSNSCIQFFKAIK